MTTVKGPKVANTLLDTEFGEFEFFCFSWGEHEEDNILCEVRRPLHEGALVRIQSACYTAEIFRSRDCDCHEQLALSLQRIAAEGGLLIYMLCDGRGAGIFKKVLGLELGRREGLDTSDAYRALSLPQDPRNYDRVITILKHFGLKSIRLLTNNPRKVAGVESGSITVTREPLEIPPTDGSRDYLLTKARKMNHQLSWAQKIRDAEEPHS